MLAHSWSKTLITYLSKYRQLIFNLLKIIVSALLLIYIFTTIDVSAFIKAIQYANLWWLLAALAMMMLGVVIRAYRWQILLDAVGVFVPLIELTNLYFIGFLFNNILPSGLGGDAIRVVELRRYSERISDAITSVLVERFLGLSALQAIALLALLADWDAVSAEVAYFTVVIFLGGLVIGYLLINRNLYLKLRAKVGLFCRLTDIKPIGNLAESFQRYPLGALGRAYLVSFIFNISLIMMNIFIGVGLGTQATLTQYAIFVPITSIILLIPITVAGLGMREKTFQHLFTQVGVSPEIAVAMSLIVYVIGNVCTGLIGGVIYLFRGTRSVVSEKG